MEKKCRTVPSSPSSARPSRSLSPPSSKYLGKPSLTKQYHKTITNPPSFLSLCNSPQHLDPGFTVSNPPPPTGRDGEEAESHREVVQACCILLSSNEMNEMNIKIVNEYRSIEKGLVSMIFMFYSHGMMCC